jgi:hypothetical protein
MMVNFKLQHPAGEINIKIIAVLLHLQNFSTNLQLAPKVPYSNAPRFEYKNHLAIVRANR